MEGGVEQSGPYAPFRKMCVVGRLASLSVPVVQGVCVLPACELGRAGLRTPVLKYNTINMQYNYDLTGKD